MKFNCEAVRETIKQKSFQLGHGDYRNLVAVDDVLSVLRLQEKELRQIRRKDSRKMGGDLSNYIRISQILGEEK